MEDIARGLIHRSRLDAHAVFTMAAESAPARNAFSTKPFVSGSIARARNNPPENPLTLSSVDEEMNVEKGWRV